MPRREELVGRVSLFSFFHVQVGPESIFVHGHIVLGEAEMRKASEKVAIATLKDIDFGVVEFRVAMTFVGAIQAAQLAIGGWPTFGGEFAVEDDGSRGAGLVGGEEGMLDAIDGGDIFGLADGPAFVFVAVAAVDDAEASERAGQRLGEQRGQRFAGNHVAVGVTAFDGGQSEAHLLALPGVFVCQLNRQIQATGQRVRGSAVVADGGIGHVGAVAAQALRFAGALVHGHVQVGALRFSDRQDVGRGRADH